MPWAVGCSVEGSAFDLPGGTAACARDEVCGVAGSWGVSAAASVDASVATSIDDTSRGRTVGSMSSIGARQGISRERAPVGPSAVSVGSDRAHEAGDDAALWAGQVVESTVGANLA